MLDRRVSRLTTINLGTMDLARNPGIEYRGVMLIHHPERIKLELRHRARARKQSSYAPYAGPFDLTLVKTDRIVQFVPNKIAPICLFGAPYDDFDSGYVAGFGSDSFAHQCWTSKDGPNPFEECASVILNSLSLL